MGLFSVFKRKDSNKKNKSAGPISDKPPQINSDDLFIGLGLNNLSISSEQKNGNTNNNNGSKDHPSSLDAMFNNILGGSTGNVDVVKSNSTFLNDNEDNSFALVFRYLDQSTEEKHIPLQSSHGNKSSHENSTPYKLSTDNDHSLQNTPVMNSLSTRSSPLISENNSSMNLHSNTPNKSQGSFNRSSSGKNKKNNNEPLVSMGKTSLQHEGSLLNPLIDLNDNSNHSSVKPPERHKSVYKSSSSTSTSLQKNQKQQINNPAAHRSKTSVSSRSIYAKSRSVPSSPMLQPSQSMTPYMHPGMMMNSMSSPQLYQSGVSASNPSMRTMQPMGHYSPQGYPQYNFPRSTLRISSSEEEEDHLPLAFTQMKNKSTPNLLPADTSRQGSKSFSIDQVGRSKSTSVSSPSRKKPGKHSATQPRKQSMMTVHSDHTMNSSEDSIVVQQPLSSSELNGGVNHNNINSTDSIEVAVKPNQQDPEQQHQLWNLYYQRMAAIQIKKQEDAVKEKKSKKSSSSKKSR